MDCGLFEGSFYVVHEPTYVNKLNVRLNTIQTNLVHHIVSSECIKRLHIEFGAIGDGIIWHKDHFELVPDTPVQEYKPLTMHSIYNFYFSNYFPILLFTTVVIINSFTRVIIFSSI